LLDVVVLMPVAEFVAVSVAPGITAPLGSKANPEMLPVVAHQTIPDDRRRVNRS